MDLLTTLKGQYIEDPVFGKLLKDLKNYKNFCERDELLYLKDKGQEMLCVPDIVVNGRSVREVIISQAHSLLAHLGPHITLGMLRAPNGKTAKGEKGILEVGFHPAPTRYRSRKAHQRN